mmetsp:Transcript_25222/g.79920  ORF Transcript_25222/g.79920 Transcript_25222/m.79920 type:complete len:210 (+) Transcript_25222:550-1179(+)
MSSSRSSSTAFQYRTTSSESVQSRTTTQHGRDCSGRIATSMSPSVAAPSDAITTTTRCPLARSTSAWAWMRAVACRICSHSGVRPVGPLLISFLTASTSATASPPMPTLSTCGEPPPGGLSSRSSVGAPRLAASVACQIRESPSSSQRLASTKPSRPPGPRMIRLPSVVCIEPELSMIQIRSGNDSLERRNEALMPGGMPRLRRKPSEV